MWSKHIHKILISKIGMKPTTHEQSLYKGTYDGQKIYMLRQADDFAVSALNEHVANKFLEQLDEHLIEPLKMQGVLNYFNGINIVQSQNFLTINCKMYLDRVCERHRWQGMISETNKGITPMTSDSKIIRMLETTIGPENKIDQRKLEK